MCFFFKCILSVSFCCGLFMYCSSVLCGLNQGIAAKEPCAQSISILNTKFAFSRNFIVAGILFLIASSSG